MIHVDENTDTFEISGPKAHVLSELTGIIMSIADAQEMDAELLLVDISASIKFTNLVKSGMDPDEAFVVLGYKDHK